MKCPNCGAEIETGSRKCSFCDTMISAEMQRENEVLQKSGCPKCKSTNITFSRENQGEIRGKNAKKIVHKTVGLCKDCGYTWYADVDNGGNNKPRKTWLWVLGWIFIFPVPLTILLLRKKTMNPVLKYGIIAVAFAVYLFWIVAASGSNDEKTIDPAADNDTKTEDVVDNSKFDFEIEVGEPGEYGVEMVFNEGTELENREICYFIPVGTYVIKNLGTYQGQISIVKNARIVNEDGWEEPEEVKDVFIIKPDEEIEITIEDGYYLDIEVNATLGVRRIQK